MRTATTSQFDEKYMKQVLGSAAVAVLIALSTSTSAVAQTYRCEVGGKTVYQQQPCDGGTRLKTEPTPDPKSREYQVNRAIALKVAIVGMTEAELVRSRGRPFHVANVDASKGPADVWYYEKTSASPRQSVMLRNGIVVNVQQ
jgi:hypothetical protein